MKPTTIIKKLLVSLALIIIILISGSYIYEIFAAPSGITGLLRHSTPNDEETQKVIDAIESEIAQEQDEALALLVYDTEIEDVNISRDGDWATAQLVPLDPESQQVIPTEPGLAIAHREGDSWKAFLPSDPLWALLIREVPDDLISPEQKENWIQIADIQASAATVGPFAGYHLPWKGYETLSLTQSVGHDRYTPSGSAHFAFDFATAGYPSGMFDVYAAKSGIVKRVVWSYPNGNTTNTNYLVLEDTSTNPVTYQLYMHFAQNSIPPELRIIGAPVLQGTFIGKADDTGVSSGNHLHFMVHTYPSSYWGTSVDITFSEVNINGGRPRIRSDLAYCRSTDICETTQTSYVSQNFLHPDGVPPQGGITSPQKGFTVSSDMVRLEGYASDDNSGLLSVQFIAQYNGKWNNIGNTFNTNNFSMDWDLCASDVPDGPVSISLVIKDRALNQAAGLPGLTHIIKNFSCPPPSPVCVPTANQVALFAEKNYGIGLEDPGNCVLLNSGNYSSPTYLGDIGDNNTTSIQVGAGVQATLYSDNNYQGRGETFIANDSNLQENRIGDKTVSSVKVQARTVIPSVPTLVWPLANATYHSSDSFSLSWENAGGALQYQARLMKGSSQVLITPWQSQAFLHINSLASGNYQWQVKGKNSAGESAWSTARSLVVQPSSTPTIPLVTAPFTDPMETNNNGWIYSNWLLDTDVNHTPGGTYSWKYEVGALDGYDNGSPNSGSLTSPIISIPESEPYYLRFWYQYKTESRYLHWDQRWVQISVDGGGFSNLIQLSGEVSDLWLGSPVISLEDYAGKNIQVRFFFTTLDKNLNAYKGWYIDDFSITTMPPPACSDSNNEISQATPINYYAPAYEAICPGGDVDF